jgi:hypothetical protein
MRKGFWVLGSGPVKFAPLVFCEEFNGLKVLGSKVRGQRSEDSVQVSGFRCQRSEDRDQRTAFRCQVSGVRK